MSNRNIRPKGEEKKVNFLLKKVNADDVYEGSLLAHGSYENSEQIAESNKIKFQKANGGLNLLKLLRNLTAVAAITILIAGGATLGFGLGVVLVSAGLALVGNVLNTVVQEKERKRDSVLFSLNKNNGFFSNATSPDNYAFDQTRKRLEAKGKLGTPKPAM